MSRGAWVPLAALAVAGVWIYTRATTAPRDDDHAHPPGRHGGQLVSLGGDRYHVEAVRAGGELRLFTLGRDESQVLEVEAQSLTAYLRAEGSAEAVAVSLEPAPLPGDAPGRTSQFVGRLPPGLEGKALLVTVPALRIGGERFRVAFRTAVGGHDVAMPPGATPDEERDLYLTPGGRYTREDIAANGGLTAAQKYRGFRAEHDYNPRPGQRVCPVTRTRADPRCTWTVGGQVYWFCCPPCIDEFVRLARERPAEVLAPEDYIKR